MTPMPSHTGSARRGSAASGTADMQVGIWLPVYGGWLRTLDIPPEASIRSCLDTAQLAEACGYDFLYCSENLLNPVHGPTAAVIDAWSLLSAVAATTRRIDLCAAVKPGFRSALQVARMVDTISGIANRRIAIGIVCGWWQAEFDKAGVAWLDHAGRYDRAEAFLTELHDLFENGDHGLTRAHHPDAWIAGQSTRAIEMTADSGTCLFLNGMEDDDLAQLVTAQRDAAAATGRKVTIAINAHVIAEPTNSAAQARLDQLIARRDARSIALFRTIMQQSGAASWANLDDAAMVDSNAGFAAGLIGDYATLRARVRQLHALGVDRILCQFDTPEIDAPAFMSEVITPLRTPTPAQVAALP